MTAEKTNYLFIFREQKEAKIQKEKKQLISPLNEEQFKYLVMT